MKAEELRLGNLVYCKITCSITHILKEFVGTETDDEFIQIEHIEPIPLTEEWLLKCGATKTGDLSFVYGRFILSFKEKYNYWYVMGHDFNYLTKVEYVHEWQNFVFVMDGEELTIKL